MILEHGEARTFAPFDRFDMWERDRGRSLAELLDEFEALRRRNLEELRRLRTEGLDLGATGLHPELGPVRLGQLLATWVAHDLSHVRQVARTMARRYAPAVGPWKEYLPVMEG